MRANGWGWRHQTALSGIRWGALALSVSLMAGWLGMLVSDAAVASEPTERAVWPAFLGEGSSAIDAGELPISWDASSAMLWEAELPGHGQSSPVVWGDRVFVSSVEGPMKDTWHVLCFDLTTGARLWQHSLVNSLPVESSLYVSRAAPTPVVDAERVVVQFESGDCVALTHAGEPIWQRVLSEEYGAPVNEFGLGASPCQDAQRVFVLMEHDGPSFLLALDKQTGQTVWQVERQSRRSWSSPVLLEIAGQPQVVVSSAGTVDGYDPADGRWLWSFTEVGGNTGVSPRGVGADGVLIGASAGRQGENAEEAKRSNALLRVSRQGDDFEVRRVWSNADASPSWASPIYHQGLAYWINRVGVVTCIDAESGETLYTSRTKQSCWATPLAVGERIYLFGKDGLCTVIAAGRKFEVLGESNLWDPEALQPEAAPQAEESTPERQRSAAMFSGPTVYGYAVAEGRFVVRIGHRLFCLGES